VSISPKILLQTIANDRIGFLVLLITSFIFFITARFNKRCEQGYLRISLTPSTKEAFSKTTLEKRSIALALDWLLMYSRTIFKPILISMNDRTCTFLIPFQQHPPHRGGQI